MSCRVLAHTARHACHVFCASSGPACRHASANSLAGDPPGAHFPRHIAMRSMARAGGGGYAHRPPLRHGSRVVASRPLSLFPSDSRRSPAVLGVWRTDDSSRRRGNPPLAEHQPPSWHRPPDLGLCSAWGGGSPLDERARLPAAGQARCIPSNSRRSPIPSTPPSGACPRHIAGGAWLLPGKPWARSGSQLMLSSQSVPGIEPVWPFGR